MLDKLLKRVVYIKKLIKNETIYIYVCIFFAGICISLLNALNPFSGYYHLNDSGAFSYIGKAIYEYGAIPYRDIFDHKGPLLYLINYLGYALDVLVPGDRIYGIWIIEFILIQIDLVIVYFICRKAKFDKIISLFATLSFAILFGVFYNFGNFASEYALPFILISLYCFVDYIFHKENIPKINILIIGFSFGSVLMLRPNMIGLWIAFCLALVIYFIYQKEYKNLFISIAYFILGLFISVIPYFIYIFKEGIINEFIKCYWTFNISYIGKDGSSLNLISQTLKYFSYPSFVFSMIIYIIQIYRNKNNKKIAVYYFGLFLFCIFTLYFVVSPCNSHRNYGMFTIPCTIIGIVELLRLTISFLYSGANRGLKRRNILKIITLLAVVLVFYAQSIFGLYLEGFSVNFDPPHQINSGYIDFVKENTDIDDKILGIGHECYLYLDADREASSRYIYHFPIYDIDPNIREEYIAELKSCKSKLILIPTRNLFQQVATDTIECLDEMVLENKYEKIVDAVPKSIIYIRVDK